MGDSASLSTVPTRETLVQRPLALIVWRAYLVVFLANCATLVLQLVAGRLLSPFIGVSLATWTAIIGVFLAGISLGAPGQQPGGDHDPA